MHIDLLRTFSDRASEVDDADDWLRQLQQAQGQLSWRHLHEKPVCVVLGEAGIGKTAEFENEVARLQAAGSAAFLIPLNQIVDGPSWERAISESASDYANWRQSSEIGHFFLDAVDEARLVSHAAFKNALSIIGLALARSMSRVRIAISSRITDWAISDVRESVKRYMVAPTAPASVETQSSRAVAQVNESELIDAKLQDAPPSSAAEIFVVSLDPLSRPEAEKLAHFFGLREPEAFWGQVADGDYDFMASRPLDLRWMVQQWNERDSLGSYSELLEGNIAHRLVETNPSYQAAGAVLSKDQLRSGAELLAAATEFSGRPFLSTVGATSADALELDPCDVLSGWTPLDVSRLISSAIFDEASFDRIKFHHRSIREYLAACYLNGLLGRGVLFHQLTPLFSASPFGVQVLIPTRRAVLCWLAALNVQAREWVVLNFPELLLYEGDPEAWDPLSIAQAFEGYVMRVKSGLRPDWHNNASELRRVARRLPSGRVRAIVSAEPPGSRLTVNLLPLIMYGGLTDCADVMFHLYRHPRAPARERDQALETLSIIASPAHRAAIAQDLLSGTLSTNELIASALPLAGWMGFDVGQLTGVLERTGAEEEFGGGPMVRAVTQELLPTTTAESSALLLAAVVGALPPTPPGPRFSSSPVASETPRAWLLHVLPDCFERALMLAPVCLEGAPASWFEAAQQIEAMRYTGLASAPEDSKRLQAQIARHPGLRWPLALAIVRSCEPKLATSRLTWGNGCMVSFSISDLPELTIRANDVARSEEERCIWFEIALTLALRDLKGRDRTQQIERLTSGVDRAVRDPAAVLAKAQWLAGAKQRQQYRRSERAKKQRQRADHARNRGQLMRDIEGIRHGILRNSLHWLIRYAWDHSGRKSLTRVDIEIVTKDFGRPLGEALRAGLLQAWGTSCTPNPSDFENQIPWEAIAALAGLYEWISSGNDIASLNDADAERAAKLAVWELSVPPHWFQRLAETHQCAVVRALAPWIEAQARTDTSPIRRALELALRSPSSVRGPLLKPLVSTLLKDQIKDAELYTRLLEAMRQDHLITTAEVSRICQQKLLASLSQDGLIADIGWLGTWLAAAPLEAWHWFESHLKNVSANAEGEMLTLGKALSDLKWSQVPVPDVVIGVMSSMLPLLGQYLPPQSQQRSAEFGHPVAILRLHIVQMLVETPGAPANRALTQMYAQQSDQLTKDWLTARMIDHAGREAEANAKLTLTEVKSLGAPLLSDPRSEAQLFKQVLARLEEIRTGVQDGPFSDRDVLRLGIPESHLQRWLAARLRDTPNRRFSIHREEEVDRNKVTDIQLSCRYGNVCIEIKALDATRSYSANSLAATLGTQIVNQYLKGYNSAHGILVLFRLDEKSWDIPGGEKDRPFGELVQHLQCEADAIRNTSPGVRELLVFCIDCVA